MSRAVLTRRRAVLSLLAAVAGPSIPWGPAQAQSRSGRWIVTKTDYPPRILALGRAEQAGAAQTRAALEQGDTPQIKAYRDFLDNKAARKTSLNARLEAVNDYVNTHVRAVDDFVLYLKDDVWSPPADTLTRGGDCEDIALVKFWGLERLGVASSDLFLILGLSLVYKPPEGHAVLGVRLPDGHFAILDNLQSRIVLARDLKQFEPAYALNKSGFWRIDDPQRHNGDYWRQVFQHAKLEGH